MLKNLRLILPWLILGGIILAFYTGYLPARFAPLFSGIIFLLSFLQDLWKLHKFPDLKASRFEKFINFVLQPLAIFSSFVAFGIQLLYN